MSVAIETLRHYIGKVYEFMHGWELFCQNLLGKIFKDENEAKEFARHRTGGQIYPDSLNVFGSGHLFLGKWNGQKHLCLVGKEKGFDDFEGQWQGSRASWVKICPLNHHNAEVLRAYFPFTRPVSLGKGGITLGLGDRLGLASPGHIRLLKKTGIKAALAQQSMRELTLTGRTYQQVLDAVSWAVFQEGYRGGFAADGDHLKSKDEVQAALDAGYTMITLDCSGKIVDEVFHYTPAHIDRIYGTLPTHIKQDLESRYSDKRFSIRGQFQLTTTRNDIKVIWLAYGAAIQMVKEIYEDVLKDIGRPLDLEVSVDETSVPTTHQAHFIIANELLRSGINLTSLAPRFVGKFEKGIDYVGNIETFKEDFKDHALIADHFGYRLSIHSGSDKFSIFPTIGRFTGGRVHVKTAGTNWLEALRIIARFQPALFRKIHAYALVGFYDATKYYHVSTDITKIREISHVPDRDLEKLLDSDDHRQLLHITYGQILTARDQRGGYLFRDNIYQVLKNMEEEYYQALEHHIGRHLQLLTDSSALG